jgi:hypothetical protein
METNTKARFELGQVVATPGAWGALQASSTRAFELLARHVSGDWGEVSPEDAEENERGIEQGWRILSSYRLSNSQKVWIITEADRSTTTLLLPEEY